MSTKTIPSTLAQNNFGQILDDVVQNNTRYVIKRRGTPKAIVISLSDFELILESDKERKSMSSIVKDLSPSYNIGEPIEGEIK